MGVVGGRGLRSYFHFRLFLREYDPLIRKDFPSKFIHLSFKILGFPLKIGTLSSKKITRNHPLLFSLSSQAIALAKVAEDGEPQAHERKELEQALSGFFLLKYGTDQPLLRRQDSDIQHMKHHTTKRKFRNIEKITKELEATPTGHAHPGEEDEEERDDYVPMKPGFTQEADTSSSDEDGYCHMEKV